MLLEPDVQREADSGELVDVLQPLGDRPPLVMIHAMGGQTGCYQPLADCLAPVTPVYGLRAPKPGEPLYPLTTVEALADAYLRALPAIPQHGTATLCGWSMGGLIAYEMARRLKARGAPVGPVILVDTWLRREQLMEEAPEAHRLMLERRKWRVFMKLATGLVGALEADDHPFWTLDDAARRAFILEIATRENPARYGAPDAAARLDEDYAHYMILRGASDIYKPGPSRVRMVWIGADDEQDRVSPTVWAELAGGGLEMTSCPGRHLQIVHHPWVATLSRSISAVMQGAR